MLLAAEQAAVVLLAVTGGGSLYGITGAFLAVPVVAVVVEIWRYLDERIALSAGERVTDSAPNPTEPTGDAGSSPAAS